ncbi:MAG: DNA primase [Candidatus Loosdrechtia sp.]|uniref:DNA primase n=1 Tax=Candidatus Loosdrechtia sp. TaxID=3101272 RepID=UPI003A728979|nr:MAG: DNA primase [Candidatus Jettenia sp. AMX2]
MVNIIPQEKILEIQQTSNITQIISEYVHLKQSGRNFVGLCPFHQEKTPSFTVNPEKKFFKCFGCGEGGTVFHFIMKQESVDFVEAVKLVAAKAHIDISFLSVKKTSASDIGKISLINVNNIVAKLYHKILLHKEYGNTAMAYAQQRQINNQSIETFCLGYAPNGWDTLLKICKDHNITHEQLEKAGLIIRKKEGNTYYDRFRNRLIFPIFDVRKQVIGFGARTLNDATPKYLNSPETILFNKSNVLYGIDIAKNAIQKQRRVILMEGYTDVVMAHQHGIDWSVAVLGTAISKQHLKQLQNYCNQVILLMDSDSAGRKSSDRSLDIFIEEEFDVRVAQLPGGYDPCDFLIREGAEKLLKCIDNAGDFFSFKIEMAATKWDMSTLQGKTNAINDVLSTAIKIPDSIKRNLLIKMIAEEMSVEETSLRAYLQKFKYMPATGIKGAVEHRTNASTLAEREVLYLMLSCNDLIPTVLQDIGLGEFSNKDLIAIAGKITELYHKNKQIKYEDVLLHLDNANLGRIVTDIVTTAEFQNVTNHKERLEACITYFKKRNNKKQICQTKKKMLEIVKSGKNNEEEITILLNELHKRNKHIHTLKNQGIGR